MLMGRWVVIRRRRRFCSRELPRPVRYGPHVWKTKNYQDGAFIAGRYSQVVGGEYRGGKVEKVETAEEQSSNRRI